MTIRTIQHLFEARPTIEGAGVRLKRGFGGEHLALLDPFLLFDDFSSTYEADYKAGFPWHPHRGMETVTYLLSGEVEHKDSLGNEGNLVSGDVQWMRAGSGIIHQEMPQPTVGGLAGFQLWVNLPKTQKMSNPHYQDIVSAAIPSIDTDGARIKIISGNLSGEHGPATHVAGSPTYLDVSLQKGGSFDFPTVSTDTVLLYTISGTLLFGTERSPVAKEHVVLTAHGESIHVEAATDGVRFLLISGTPLHEPVAWHGPIVMNTDAEIREALADLRNHTFIQETHHT